MCGIAAVIGHSQSSIALYNALMLLQHRGQDAAGIATCNNKQLHIHKGHGLVANVVHSRHIEALRGDMGIAHVRYPTAGAARDINLVQPLYVNSPFGLCLAHNGNLVNTAQLAAQIYDTDLRHINTNSDSEVLLNVLAHELKEVAQSQLQPEHIFKAVAGVHKRCFGAYAYATMIMGYGLLAVRDPFGIRPLVLGKKTINGKTSYMVASESVALDAVDYQLVRDVKPGEAIYINEKGELFSQICADNTALMPCLFEYIYLARPDSIIDKISVHKARLSMGRNLGQSILNNWPNNDIDVVIPVPDTSRIIAIELAQQLNKKCREGLVKNRYIGRTFIMAEQANREKSVKQKLNKIDLEFKDKNVLLVDDSIVRGTTSRQIVEMARSAGAKKVYFASAAPEVLYPNVYGIDMPVAKELIAHGRSNAEIAAAIGADKVIFQTLADTIAACKFGDEEVDGFETSVFDGKYICGGVTQEYLTDIGVTRADKSGFGGQKFGAMELRSL